MNEGENKCISLKEQSAYSQRPDKSQSFKSLVQWLKRKKPKDLDAVMHNCHDAVFSQLDCLKCANCCKTTGPLFTEKDIGRLAKQLKLKVTDFEQRYLRTDEDGDKVLQSTPCPFLGSDNHCSVYKQRPKACREYPHTDRRRQKQLLNLTLKNTQMCPAVHDIMERLEAHYRRS
jgi:Fe-S-cluster containining protein